jgi:RNA polymerase sigma factor FliA
MASSTHIRSDRLRSAYREAEATRSGALEAEVLRHLPLVHTVVERIAAHLPPTVDREDLLHAGVIGLIDALNRFDAARDNAFSTYAVLRIRGQVIDELRARDWVPRGARGRAREYQAAVAALSQRLGRLPHDDELAAHLGVDEHELLLIEQDAQLAVQVSLESPVGEDGHLGALISSGRDEDDPSRAMEHEDRRRLLARILATLSEQERMVVKLYYFENLLMKEIAELLGVTESRVCQIHTRIIAVLRTRLGDPELVG